MQSSYPQLVLLRARGLNVLARKNRVVVNDGIGADMRLGVCVELLGLGCEVEVDWERPVGKKLVHVSHAIRDRAPYHAKKKKMRGMHMACLVPILSATFPRMTGMIAPPQTEETRKEAPRLVWRPMPRSDKANMIGNMQDSKKST
jgi:hypothetical protein